MKPQKNNDLNNFVKGMAVLGSLCKVSGIQVPTTLPLHHALTPFSTPPQVLGSSPQLQLSYLHSGQQWKGKGAKNGKGDFQMLLPDTAAYVPLART